MTELGGTLAVIPARRGSKRLPGKNLRLVAGKPMIQWTIEAALESAAIDRIVVTSDDDEVLSLAGQLGVDGLLRRPAALATDEATSVDVVRHVIAHAQASGSPPRTICLLQPTSPLRTASDIDNAMALHLPGERSVISVCPLDHPLSWCLTVDASLRVRRLADDFATPGNVHRPNGAIYIASTESFSAHGSFIDATTVAYVMDVNRSVDVDTLADYLLCDALARR